ncbi:MAG: hypothetical protein WAR79_01270 [Melioribacteraceae bacterium]
MINNKKVTDLPELLNKTVIAVKKTFGYGPMTKKDNDLTQYVYEYKNEILIFYSKAGRIITFNYRRIFPNSAILKQTSMNYEKELLTAGFRYIKSSINKKTLIQKNIIVEIILDKNNKNWLVLNGY